MEIDGNWEALEATNDCHQDFFQKPVEQEVANAFWNVVLLPISARKRRFHDMPAGEKMQAYPTKANHSHDDSNSDSDDDDSDSDEDGRD